MGDRPVDWPADPVLDLAARLDPEAQTPLLVGRAAVALARADDLMARSGTIQWVEDLVDEFDLHDEHGHRPRGCVRRVR